MFGFEREIESRTLVRFALHFNGSIQANCNVFANAEAKTVPIRIHLGCGVGLNLRVWLEKQLLLFLVHSKAFVSHIDGDLGCLLIFLFRCCPHCNSLTLRRKLDCIGNEIDHDLASTLRIKHQGLVAQTKGIPINLNPTELSLVLHHLDHLVKDLR